MWRQLLVLSFHVKSGEFLACLSLSLSFYLQYFDMDGWLMARFLFSLSVYFYRFRIDNTDHIIDVNKNNIPFEYDQVNIICPVYTPGTHEDDAEKYIIYNVSKEEYDTCRITNPNPRIIAVCDKPYKLMYFTITFRSFTPQPGGLEFRPGQDYYFICKFLFFSPLPLECVFFLFIILNFQFLFFISSWQPLRPRMICTDASEAAAPPTIWKWSSKCAAKPKTWIKVPYIALEAIGEM